MRTGLVGMVVIAAFAAGPAVAQAPLPGAKFTQISVPIVSADAPDLENHTVNLSVYVVDGAHRNDCDGGQYRIVQTPPPKAPANKHG